MQVSVKILTLQYHKDTLFDLTCEMKSFWRAEDVTNASLRESIDKLFTMTNIVFRFVIGIFLLLQMLTFLKPVIHKNTVPIGVYSYDEENRALYIFVLVIEELLTLLVFFPTPSLDMIYIGVCTSLMAQFKMLRDFLETANVRQSYLADTKKAVEHHNLLIRYELVTSTYLEI